ncbi:MAG: hypothetical protein U0414_19160 [Polyangiaceae bacterium]
MTMSLQGRASDAPDESQAPGDIEVRMYRIGFGDAFLVVLPAADGARRTVLFDCGRHFQTPRAAVEGVAPPPSEDAIVGRIIEDVVEIAGRARIDVVVATHRHQDHVSGFESARWAEVEVGEVWMPWTEDPEDPEARKIQRTQSALAKRLELDVRRLGASAGDGTLGLVMNSLTNERAMTTLHSGFRGRARRRFLEGNMQTMAVDGLPGVIVHVLGPARDEDIIRDMDPPSGQSYLSASAPGSGAAGDRGPFDRKWVVQDPAALIDAVTPDMAAYLGDLATGDAFVVAAALEKSVNGTSLMLAFEVGDAMLLFPGDAQWGTWRRVLESPRGRAILERTTFYKVGHHGSHNATPVEFVDECLGEDFSAMASVWPVKKFPRIPKRELLEALEAKTDRLARADVPPSSTAHFAHDEEVVVTRVPTRRAGGAAPRRARDTKTKAAPADTRDPLSVFVSDIPAPRARTAKPFASGEHVWLGARGAERAVKQAARDFKWDIPADLFTAIRRKHGKDLFGYGELVALSGDFYPTPAELFEETPAAIPWLFERNDVSDIRALIQKELAFVEAPRTEHREYPDLNVAYAWNAKYYVELALDNVAHFGFHNMVAYCFHHDAALRLAATRPLDDETRRRALVTAAFADHFLTDAFAAGHVRIPRAEIVRWARTKKYGDKIAGALSKLIHDQDGHVDLKSVHGVSEGGRPDDDGLHVRNALGEEWHTRCDGQLFLDAGSMKSPAVERAVDAVRASVLELLAALYEGELPKGVFEATKHAPFPHGDEAPLASKFSPNLPPKTLDKLWKSVSWYAKVPLLAGLERSHLDDFLASLPALMVDFRANIAGAIQGDELLRARAAPGYLDGFRNIA